MRLLLAIRDALSRFYGKYDTPIRLVFKYLLALGTFLAINGKLGQMAALNHLLLVAGLALLCTFLPSGSIVMVGTAMILVHFYGISFEAALAGGGMMIIGCLLYFSIAPSSSAPALLTALALGAGVPCAVPVIFGLIGGPLSAAGVIFGTFVYYLMDIVDFAGGSLQATAVDAAEAMVQKMTVLIDAVIHHQEMYLMCFALAVVLWVVCLIRNMAVKYAWTLASVLGVASYLVIRIGGAILCGLELSTLSLTLDAAAALLAAWFAQTLLFQLDYRRTEAVRFEDDEYIYYVKAVPKRKIRRKRRARRAERR